MWLTGVELNHAHIHTHRDAHWKTHNPQPGQQNVFINIDASVCVSSEFMVYSSKAETKWNTHIHAGGREKRSMTAVIYSKWETLETLQTAFTSLLIFLH